MPAPPAPAQETPANENAKWTEDSGDTRWYLFDISTEKIAGDPADIVKLIRCTPETPRKNDTPRQTLSEIRAKVEKHIKNTYLKQVQAPIGVKRELRNFDGIRTSDRCEQSIGTQEWETETRALVGTKQLAGVYHMPHAKNQQLKLIPLSFAIAASVKVRFFAEPQWG